MLMIDYYGRQSCHFCFKGIYGPKANNCRKCLILFVTAVVSRENWLSLITLLNTDLSRQFCSGMLLKVGENTF